MSAETSRWWVESVSLPDTSSTQIIASKKLFPAETYFKTSPDERREIAYLSLETGPMCNLISLKH